MIGPPPRSTLTDTHFPATTLFRSRRSGRQSSNSIQKVLSTDRLVDDQFIAGQSRLCLKLGGAIGGDQGRPPAPTEKPHLTEQGNAVQPGHPIVGNEAKRVAVGLIGDKLRAGRIGADIQILAQQQRSEEHTSELQSLMRISYAVFCLKKKKHTKQTPYTT